MRARPAPSNFARNWREFLAAVSRSGAIFALLRFVISLASPLASLVSLPSSSGRAREPVLCPSFSPANCRCLRISLRLSLSFCPFPSRSRRERHDENDARGGRREGAAEVAPGKNVSARGAVTTTTTTTMMVLLLVDPRTPIRVDSFSLALVSSPVGIVRKATR